MKNNLSVIFEYALSQRKYHWLIKNKFQKSLFYIRRFFYRINEKKKNQFKNTVSFAQIVKITLGNVLLSLLLAIFIQWIDPHIFKFVNDKIYQVKIPDDSDYVTFLASITSIGGIFLGLYYAAISTIGSSFYSKVPNNIRDLYKQERIGNVYMSLLAFFTFLGLSFISFHLVGLERNFTAIPLMLIGAGIGIISFVKLGQRAFNLFDPTILSQNIFDKLNQFIELVSYKGYQWSNASFQYHAYRIASDCINSLKALADITKKELHLKGLPHLSLSKNLLSFLIYYENKKACIPTDSHWFEQKYIHKDWYRTDYTRVSTAHQTGTSLQPEIERDSDWLEKRLLEIVEDCFANNLIDERFIEVLDLFNYLEAYLKKLALQGKAYSAIDILRNTSNKLFATLLENSKDEVITNEFIEKIGIAEQIAILPAMISISYFEYLSSDSYLRSIDKMLQKIDWGKRKSIYSNCLFSYQLPRLEWFFERINYELQTDNKILTPIWYQKELLYQIEAENFKKNLDSIIYDCASLFTKWIELAEKMKHPWIQAALISKAWEFWHKISYQQTKWNDFWEKINIDRRIDGLPWPNLEIDNILSYVENKKKNILEMMSNQQTLLEVLMRKDNFPDYPGQFLHTLGETCIEAFCQNDHELVEILFNKYLIGSILRFEKLRPKTEMVEWLLKNEFKIAIAPLLDLLELSGYAKLFADYYNDEAIWNIITKSWNDYIRKNNVASPIQVFLTSIMLSEGSFEIPHRGVLRTNWKMKVEQRISDVSTHTEYINGFIPETIVDHTSPLVRIFSKKPHGSMYDGIDIFYCFFLSGIDESFNDKIGWRRRNLKDSINREIENYESRKVNED